LDDITGAMNRREIAQKAYNAEAAAYQQVRRNTCGRVASWLLSPDSGEVSLQKN
jgi:hypothetical protein